MNTSNHPANNSSTTASTPPGRNPWRNPWVIGWILIIVVIVSVNLFMVYLAANTSPGLVVEDYYDRGQDYEKTILTRQALARQLSLRLEAPPEIQLGQPATFGFTGAGKDGQPISIDAVTLHAYRPSDCAHDFSVLMTKAPATAGGAARYLTQVTFPLKGVWDIVVAAEHGGREHNVARRITVAAD